MSARVAILGLTVSGNKGAESMLLAILEQISLRLGPCEFDLLTVYPREDAARPVPDNLHLVPARPLTMLLLVAPLSALYALLLRLPLLRPLLRLVPPLRALLDADLVIDSSGVAFVDGRGLPLLVYNLVVCLPPKLAGRPTIKVSQALGPFRGRLNRLLAGFALRRLDAVVARGETSGEHLKSLNLSRAHVCADTAFLMPTPPAAQRGADQRLANFAPGARRVGISPSVVVEDYCARRGIDYADTLARFVERLRAQGFAVVLLPHSVRPESRKRMNNDLLVCDGIMERLRPGADVLLVRDELSAPELRAMIGRMDFYVASRFHSMVSALATGVPTLLIGWSHKYREVMRMFDLEQWALGYERLSVEGLIELFDELRAAEPEVLERLKRRLPEVRRSAARNFDLAAGLLSRSVSRPAAHEPA